MRSRFTPHPPCHDVLPPFGTTVLVTALMPLKLWSRVNHFKRVSVFVTANSFPLVHEIPLSFLHCPCIQKQWKTSLWEACDSSSLWASQDSISCSVCSWVYCHPWTKQLSATGPGTVASCFFLCLLDYVLLVTCVWDIKIIATNIYQFTYSTQLASSSLKPTHFLVSH